MCVKEGDASAFRARKNTFIESSYVPRPDAQVIIMSNRHLFECIGKSERYTETPVGYYTVKKMLERFNIIKLLVDDETRPEFVDAVLHINVRDNVALCHPFDVRVNRDGDPIDKDGNLTPYSLVSKFDTRNNKSFNSMKKAILIQLGKNKNLNDYFTQEECDYRFKEYKNYEYKIVNMCVDDMLKRYIDMHGRLNEFLECDSNFDILDYFLEHQTSFPTNSKCVEFILENRHSLYESLAHKNANALDIKGRQNKCYDPKVYHETLKVFSESRNLIHDRQIYSFFELVMREIINTDQTLVTRRAYELSKSELRTVKRNIDDVDE